MQGRPAAADSSLARWERALPNDPNMMHVRFGLASMRRDYALAERRARELQAATRASRLWQANATVDFATLAAVQGHLAEGERQLRAAAQLDEERGAPDAYVTDLARLAQVEFRLRGNAAQAQATLDAALAKHPLSSMPATDRPYTVVAATEALIGRPENSRRLMAEYARVLPAGYLRQDPDRLGVPGYAAAAEGKWAEAIPAYQAAEEDNQCAACYLPDIARAYAKLGQADSARAYYERYLATNGIYRVYGDASYLASTYQALGELAEARGDRKQAVEYYEKLIDLWKTADPDLQPIVKDARQRVTRLTSEH